MGTIIKFDINSQEIQHLCNRDKHIKKLISMIGPLSYELHEDQYAFIIHEIIEQMLSIKAGNKIFSRLVNLCGGKVTPESINQLTNEEIKTIGTSSAKVTYIRNVTNAVLDWHLDFKKLESMPNDDVIKQLTDIKGIGKWTANMYLIFVLNRLDVLPTNDAAFLQAYEWLYNTNDCSENVIKKKCKKWKPYSSIACRYLYRALDNGFTKDKFHLYKKDDSNGKN